MDILLDVLFITGRILFGGFFIMSSLVHFNRLNMLSGYAASKGLPMPKLAVVLSGVMILLGGLGVILGVYTQIALGLIALFLLIVSIKMHNYWTVTDPNEKMAQRTNFNKNMALLGASLMMLVIPLPWVPVLALF